MRTLRQTILWALALGCVAAGVESPSAAQTAPREVASPLQSEAASDSVVPKAGESIEYVGPDTYILLDSKGRPQPVLGMRYEEFVAAWKRLQQGEQRVSLPRYTIEALQIGGAVHGEQAELTVEVTIRSIAAGTIKVPLGMTAAIATKKPQMERVDGSSPEGGAAKTFVSYDPDAGGYVAWIDGAADERYRVSLNVVRPVESDGNQTSVALNLPSALVSRLSLQVPVRVVDATASAGSVTNRTDASEGTHLDVEGPRGDFRLSWTTAGVEPTELASVMSATGAIGISIDGHSVRSDAVLTVRSYGGSFERILVRLPPGAQLIEGGPNDTATESPHYRVRIDTGVEDGAAGASLAIVEFAEKQTGPVEVRLSTEQPLGLTGEESSVELAGFEVVGAVRQFGDVAVAVADDWQLRWENGPYVRQVERSEVDEALRTTQPTVAFQYDRQPWSLRAEIVGRPMIVHVTPEYLLRIGADQAELQARLRYQVPGARAFEFRVRLNGWELTSEPIESSGLVDRDRSVVSRDGELVLPLNQASPRRAEITFKLRRSLPAGEAKLELPLPMPEADTLATGELVVAADAAIELVPDMNAARGLGPVPVVDSESQRSAGDSGEYYRFRMFVADALFAARCSIRPREVTAEVVTNLSLDWQKARASQEVAYDVRFQPLTELAFALPDGWTFADDRVQIVPESQSETPLFAAVTIQPEKDGRPTRVARALLAQPRIGKFGVRAEYEFDATTGEDGELADYLNLPRPTAHRLVRHQVDIATTADMVVSLNRSVDAGWRAEDSSGPEIAVTLVGHETTAQLPIEIAPISAARSPRTVLERVWLQTWQAGNLIQDRAAIRFSTSDATAIVELPPSATVADVEVLIDGSLAQANAKQEGRLVVTLPASSSWSDAPLHSHTMELRYRRAAPAGLVTRLNMTPPQLVGSSGLCDVLWHIVLPGDRHIVSAADTLNPVEPAQWLEVVLGRAAVKTQAEMEEWVGAANLPEPTETQNEYLYSGLAPVSISTVTAPRWLIVLAASGGTLLLVSAWVYLPAARRAWIAILVATAVAGLAISFPTHAVLLGQASVLGLALSASMLWLRRWSGTRSIVPAPANSTGSTNMRLRSSMRGDSYYSPPLNAALKPHENHSTSGQSTTPLVAPELER